VHWHNHQRLHGHLGGTPPAEFEETYAAQRTDHAIPGAHQLGDLAALTVLELSDNRLSGSIPARLGQLTNLGGLYIGDNHLTGCIPASLSDIANNDLDSLGLPACT